MMKTNMEPRISLEIVWQDDHMLEIEFHASKGRFSGITHVYTEANGERLIEFGKKLRGFPKNKDQEEEQEFGWTKKGIEELHEKYPMLKPHQAYAGFKFRCIDQLYHTSVVVVLQEETHLDREGANGKVSFELLFDAAQVDRFSEELISMGNQKDGMAVLEGRIDTHQE